MFAPRGWLKRPVPRMIYRTIENSQLFDPQWYRHTNLAVHEKLMDPLWHYLDIGWKKGLNPSVFFDTDYYLQANPDVKELGLNPLFHYVRYGVGEKRHPLETGLQALHAQFGPAAPVTLLSVPRATTDRVTVLLDDFTPRDSHLPYWFILATSAVLAQDSQARLRILDRRTTQTFVPVGDVLKHVEIELEHGFELIRVALSPKFHEVTAYPNEIFLATSFSSHLALTPLPTHQRRYLVSDQENRLYGDNVLGSQAHEAEAADAVERIALGINQPSGVADFSRRATWTVTAQTSDTTFEPPDDRITIAVDVDRLATGQMVATTIQALERAIKQGVVAPKHHRVVFIGKNPRPINLLASLVPEHVECENNIDLEELASRIDVLVTLARPHSLGLVELSVLATGGQVISRYFEKSQAGLHTAKAASPALVSELLQKALAKTQGRRTRLKSLSHTVRIGQ